MPNPSARLLTEALIALAFVVVGLLSVVVVVGLFQGELDITGTATMLSGLLSAMVGGFILRSKGGGNED